ncbi:hypothetical protein [Gimesia maris]|uniref:hypothetical protein n=1 Tax=Gimesia maris TaxID=122 RepID=UPI0030DAACA8|tara:strand:+ start:1679 stop:3358 length:1680 start_codon:yes stop_codon:yes gene_type:complete
MSIQDLSPEFEQLLNQLLNNRDGEFTDSEFETFHDYLATNPEAMQHYFEYLDIDSGIQPDMLERLKELEARNLEEPEPVPPLTPAPLITYDTPPARQPAFIQYALVAAASMLILLMAEWMSTGDFLWERAPNAITDTIRAELPYVATLTRATDCVWGGNSRPEFSGQRLLTEDLILEQGIAEFRFDSGTRLVIEGPTKIKLVTGCCAHLDYGSMVLHGYEASPEFTLITPLLTLHDIGTEYGARVEKDGEVDLHVFEGAVRVDPNHKNEQFAESIIIQEGQARRLKDNKSDEIELLPENFKREVPGDSKTPLALQQELRVYDSFYPAALKDPETASEWQNAGTGWKSPWTKAKNSSEPAAGESQPGKSLSRTQLAESQLGLIELRDGSMAWRALEKPIRMDTNAIYYLSFYLQKNNSGPNIKDEQFGNLSLQTSKVLAHSRKILFGMSSEGYATLQADMQIVEQAPPLQTGKPYFIVAKIVASKNAPDQVFMRVLSETETIPKREPPVWTCVSTPFHDSNTWDLVRLHVGTKGNYLFDELRIGSSWDSVVDSNPPRLER